MGSLGRWGVLVDYAFFLEPGWLAERKFGEAFPDLRVEAVGSSAPSGATIFVFACDPSSANPLHQHLWLVGQLDEVRREGDAWVGAKPNPLSAAPAPALSFLKALQGLGPVPLSELQSDRVRLLLAANELAPGPEDDERLGALEGVCAPATLQALRRRGARWRRDCHASDEGALRALLELHDYPVHAGVLEFERLFGGLAVPLRDWTSADQGVAYLGPYRTIGAGLLERGTPENPDLVPVSWGPGDSVYYLDGEARGFVEDLIEGGPQPLGTQGAPALLDSMLDWFVKETGG